MRGGLRMGWEWSSLMFSDLRSRAPVDGGDGSPESKEATQYINFGVTLTR